MVGIDLGGRRIGVAVSDPAGRLATPRRVLRRGRRRAGDHRAIAGIVGEVGAVRVVVGLPLTLGGEAGPAARQVMAEVDDLRRHLEVPVEVHDERLTTVAAERSLREIGARPEARRAGIDQVAAAVMLQSWLDRRTREGG